MKVELDSAEAADRRYIENLIPYYIYDMSEYMGWDPNGEGVYGGCDDMLETWELPGHHTYLIRADGKTAGFAVVRPCPEEAARNEIEEFFILRKFKGRGVGRAAACLLFDRHPGPWLVRVLDDNAGARSFWGKVVGAYTGGACQQSAEQYTSEHSGTWSMQCYRFASKPAPQ